MCATPVFLFLLSIPQDKLCCLSDCTVCNTSRGISFWSSVLWEYGTSCVCAAELHQSEVEGDREEQEVIGDMSQLEGSNSEKALPTCKK